MTDDKNKSHFDEKILFDVLERLRQAEVKIKLLEHKMERQLQESDRFKEMFMRIFWIVVTAVITVGITVVIGEFTDDF
jgi:hypothetical protein